MSEQTRQIGRFRIHADIVRERWQRLRPMMADFVIVRAEMDFVSDHIEYTAFSEWFEPVPLGIQAPLYDIVLWRTPDGDRVLEVNKMEGR